MQLAARKMLVGLSAGVLLLSACGGSSDDGAGQRDTPFQVSPDEVTLNSGTDSCPGPQKLGDFSVIGGAAPYIVQSPYHQLVTFSAAGGSAPTHQGTFVVPNRNGQFAIYVQGCFDPATVTILDDLKRVQTIAVSYVASGAN